MGMKRWLSGAAGVGHNSALMLSSPFSPRYQYRVSDIVHLLGENRFREIHWRGYLLPGSPGQRRRNPMYWLGSQPGIATTRTRL